MNRNKQYIIKRLLLGDKMGDIVKDLGITGQAHVSRRFIALLEKEGYYVNKIAEYHKIYNDLVKRVPVEKLITKYEHFNSEMDIQKFIKLHGLNRVELVHEKEKMIIA